MSNNRSKHLTPTESNALDVIAKFPGLTPMEIATHMPQIKPSSVSALTARLIYLRRVNRLKVPMTPTYRYYPKDAVLPKGHTEWNNALIKHNFRNKNKGNGDDKTRDLFETPQRSDTLSLQNQKSIGVLLTLEIGEKESVTLTIEQARKVYEQLALIFGERA